MPVVVEERILVLLGDERWHARDKEGKMGGERQQREWIAQGLRNEEDL